MTGESSVNQWDVLCAGLVVADHVCRPISRMPGSGELVLTPGMELTVGGCAANVATDLAKLGLITAVAGCVGDDAFGRHVSEVIQSAGVDCGPLRSCADVETACTMVLNVAGEDRRFVHVLGANAVFTADELTSDVIAQTKMISIGGYGLVESLSPENVARLFATARDVGVMTVLDVVLAEPRSYAAWLKPVLPLTDLFVPNDDEARLLVGEGEPIQFAERFHADGASTALVTCGAAGAALVSGEGRWQAAAHDVETIDSTGSGDAFLSGVIYARLQGADWPEALRYGSALGACCVQSAGSTTGIPAAGELERFVKDRPLEVSVA